MKKIGILLLNLVICIILVGACTASDAEDKTVPAEEEAVAEEALPTPDIIFYNGQIITMEPDSPQAEAIALKGEDILALGTDEEILELKNSVTRIIDLEGKTLLPGFVDAHAHYLQSYCTGEKTLDEVQNLLLESGTTSIGEMAVSRDTLMKLQDLEKDDRLRVRTSAYLLYTNNCGDLQGDWYLDYPQILDTSRMLRIPGVKMYSDGGTCQRPAYSIELPEEYVREDSRGDLFYNSEELERMMREAQSQGYQVSVHAIGDRAVENVLDAFEAVLEGRPNIYRHRIEHNRILRPDMISRYGEIDPVVTIFCAGPMYSWMLDNPDNPMSVLIAEHPDTFPAWIQPWRSLLDANPGLHIAYHSDYPWVGKGPIHDLFALVTCKMPMADGVTIWEPPDWYAAKAITVEEALQAMTIDSAYALFMEEKIGSLKSGKYADLIVLSDNPLTIIPDEILDIQVLLTMVGGKVEYCISDFESLRTGTTEPVDEPPPAVPAVEADVIYRNGQILTMETDLPSAEAIALKGEDILAVGSNNEIMNFSGSGTKVIDLGGKTLMPGFVDAHTHILEDVISGINFQSFEELQDFEFERGITTLGWPGPNPDMMGVFYDNWLQRDGGDLRLRVNLYMKINTKCSGLFEEGWYLDYPIILDPSETLRIPGIKLYLDPAGGRCPGNNTRNTQLFTVEELTSIISDAQERNLQVVMHCSGENSVETALDAIESALDGQPNTYRHRIEHNTFTRPEFLPRYGELGVVAVTHGFLSYSCNFNEEIVSHLPDSPEPDWFFQLRPLLNANPGLCLAWHSDGNHLRPITHHLWGFVTRNGFAEDGVTICEHADFITDDALTVEEALRAMTINSAYAMRMEEKIGSLKPGKYADLVVISENPLTVADPDDLLDIRVLFTMVGGNVEYCAPGFESLKPDITQ